MNDVTFQRRAMTAAAFLCCSAAIPNLAAADTVETFNLSSGSVLAGNATTPPSAFCALARNCPTSPTYGLSASDPLSGSISFDVTTNTLTFDLVLTQNATFGSLTVGAGSSFVATAVNPVSVEVGSSTSGARTTYTIVANPSAAPTPTVQANLILPAGVSETQNLPSIPGIACSVVTKGGLPTSGSCSLTLGTALSGPDALQIAQGGTTYGGVMSISANLVPVPLPPSAIFLVGGLFGLGAFAARRNASRA
jgi:hypothetical protein